MHAYCLPGYRIYYIVEVKLLVLIHNKKGKRKNNEGVCLSLLLFCMTDIKQIVVLLNDNMHAKLYN